MRSWLAAASVLFVTACSSAGPYGYSRTYVPLSPESEAADGAHEYDPVMAERDKEEWRKSTTMLFGVVKARGSAKDGSAYLTLSMRTLSDRNLCDDFDEETCRVTVSAHEHAVVHATLKLESGDDIGEHSVGKGSLLRVVGKLTDEVDADDGGPVLRVSYYRHWPRNYYVTTAAAAGMTH
jgi:5-carboxymethyl-2-hydroxymuconate isomerase